MRGVISAFAILWLIGAGILILATGAALAWQEITRTDSCIGIECGLRQLFLIVDLVGIVFGAGYAAAGIGLWRGRPRAQDLGCVLAFVGLLLTPIFLTLFVVMLGVTWFGDWDPPDWADALLLAPVIANGVAFVGVWVWEPARS